jgi:Na+/proline symporter
LIYTFRGGIKTVIWTDTLQTTFLLLAAVVTLVFILKDLDISFVGLVSQLVDSGSTRVFDTDWHSNKFYLKQILSGAFITITMTGLDQDMMQKNLTCKTLKDAQKNMITFSLSLVVVNMLFLFLGGALVYYAQQTGFALPVNEAGVVVNDKIFPSVAFSLSTFTSVVFVIGLVAAGYSSADGTLTALTTTFYYDFIHLDKSQRYTEQQKVRFRKLIHVSFAVLYLLIIIAFKPFHNQSLIDTIFDVAGYTYGPLLGLYAFGLFTSYKVNDRYVPVVAILSPVICYILKLNSQEWLWGYQFGFEIILLNGLLTCLGLFIIRKRK